MTVVHGLLGNLSGGSLPKLPCPSYLLQAAPIKATSRQRPSVGFQLSPPKSFPTSSHRFVYLGTFWEAPAELEQLLPLYYWVLTHRMQRSEPRLTATLSD